MITGHTIGRRLKLRHRDFYCPAEEKQDLQSEFSRSDWHGGLFCFGSQLETRVESHTTQVSTNGKPRKQQHTLSESSVLVSWIFGNYCNLNSTQHTTDNSSLCQSDIDNISGTSVDFQCWYNIDRSWNLKPSGLDFKLAPLMGTESQSEGLVPRHCSHNAFEDSELRPALAFHGLYEKVSTLLCRCNMSHNLRKFLSLPICAISAATWGFQVILATPFSWKWGAIQGPSATFYHALLPCEIDRQ